MEEILRRYKYYSWKLAYQFYNEHTNSGISLDDFHQVCFSCIIPTLRSYSGHKTTFYNYWRNYAINELSKYNRDNSYLAKGWSYAGFSLDEDDDSKDYAVAEKHGLEDEGIQSGILKEELQLMFDEVTAKFKREGDLVIINLFVEGYSFEQIKKETQVPSRHVYYVVDRFQKLFSQLLKKRNYN